MDAMAPPKDYHFQWEFHKFALSDNLAEVMFTDTFSDVSLITHEGTTIPAHKLVLSSCSKYFKTIFHRFRQENPIIIVKDVSNYTLQHLLEFMYVGSTKVSTEELAAFLEAGKTFMIDGLRETKDKDDEDEDEIVKIDEDVQGKELDLSQSGPSRQNITRSPSRSSIHEHREMIVPNLIAAPQQAHINQAMINPFTTAFDNPIFNTALAMRTHPQSYLTAQLSSPSRASIPSQTLPRHSPIKSVACSPKLQAEENYMLDPASAAAANIRRFSNSPEDSTNSNTSLDLTKPSTSNSPLDRLNVVNQSLNNLAAVGQLTNHTNINVSAALASQIHQYTQQFKPPIRVSQSLLQRSRSKSPEVSEHPTRNLSQHRGVESAASFPTTHQHNSSHSSKQNSSGGSSSDHNNYSDDDSGPENKYQEERRDRSASPGPSTSTPKVNDAYVPNRGYGALPWGYPASTEEADKPPTESTSGPSGFWKNSFKNSLLAPYLSTSLPPLSPGSHNSTLSPTFPGLYNPTSLSSSWGCNSSSPPSLHSIPFLRSNECARCGRLYKTRKGLKHHIKNECGVEPRFQCTRCDWKFKQKAHLLRHMARKHTPPVTSPGALQSPVL